MNHLMFLLAYINIINCLCIKFLMKPYQTKCQHMEKNPAQTSNKLNLGGFLPIKLQI